MINMSPASPGVFTAFTMVRGSIWSSDFMDGAGGPEGTRLPWAWQVVNWGWRVARTATTASAYFNRTLFMFDLSKVQLVPLVAGKWLPLPDNAKCADETGKRNVKK